MSNGDSEEYDDLKPKGEENLEFLFDPANMANEIPHNEEDLADFDDTSFVEKLRNFAGGFAFAHELATSYFAMKDRKTPLAEKLALGGALVYFVSILDAIPDVTPILGYVDDLGVLAAAIAFAADAITQTHRDEAKDFFENDDNSSS